MRLPVLNTLFATTITCCFVLDAASSSAVSTCSNDNNIVSTQQDLSTRQFTDHLCACFTDRTELRNAIYQFLNDGCSDDNNCNNTVVQNYGWPIGSWCVSNVTDMSNMFNYASSFNQDLSSWDVSQVTNMYYMFWGASSFNQDLSSWDVSQVTGMRYMFWGASSFNQDLSSWNVSQVTDMRSIFRGASSFNQDLSSWDVSQVTDMNSMFEGASSFNQDLSSWDVSQVTYMSSMFLGASSFNQDLCSWGTKLSKDPPYISNIFSNSGCPYSSDPNLLEGGPFCASTCTPFSNHEDLKSAVDTFMVEDECTSIALTSNPGCSATKEDLSRKYGSSMVTWRVSDVTNMSFLFANMTTFNVDISDWDVSAVRTMEGMFWGASSFNQDLSSWDVWNVTNGDKMFEGTAALNDSVLCSWSAAWKRLVDCTERTSAAPTPTISTAPFDGERTSAAPTPTISTAPFNGERTSASATLSILYGASFSLLLVHLLINY